MAPHSVVKGLLVRASLELDEPLSWHPALRVSSDAGPKTGGGMVSPASLRPVGTGFTGSTAPESTTPSHVFHAGLKPRVPYGPSPYNENELTICGDSSRLRSFIHAPFLILEFMEQ